MFVLDHKLVQVEPAINPGLSVSILRKLYSWTGGARSVGIQDRTITSGTAFFIP